MSKTISFHNGSVWSRGHNIRDDRYTGGQNHIDQSLTKANITLVDIPVRQAYKNIFSTALEEYNAKQKRKDRKIKDYYNKIKDDKQKHPVYECIVQIGDRLSTGYDAELEKQALIRFSKEWSNRNPNLIPIGQYIHCDETDGTVHLHIDYIPVAKCNRGMSLQNALAKALEQQGFIEQVTSIHDTVQVRWEKRERQALYDICKEIGIDVSLERKEAPRQHMHKDEYIAEQKRIEQELANAEQEKDEKIAEMLNDINIEQLNIEGKSIPFNKAEKAYKIEDIEKLSSMAANAATVHNNAEKEKAQAAEIIAKRDEILAAADKKMEDADKYRQNIISSTAKLEDKCYQLKHSCVIAEMESRKWESKTEQLKAECLELEKKLPDITKYELEHKDNQISELQSDLSAEKNRNWDLNAKIREKNTLLTNKDNEIANLNRIVYKKDECSALSDFLCNLLHVFRKRFEVKYSPDTDSFSISGDPELNEKATETYGTPNRNAYELTIDLLNKRIDQNQAEKDKQLSIWERMKEWAINQTEKVKSLVNGIKIALYDLLVQQIEVKDTQIEELKQKLDEDKKQHKKDIDDYNELIDDYNALHIITEEVIDCPDKLDKMIEKVKDGATVKSLMKDDSIDNSQYK